MISIEAQIMQEFRAGKPPVEIRGFSSKTVYRYYKKFLLIELRDKISWLIDSGMWEVANAPMLKRLQDEISRIGKTP